MSFTYHRLAAPNTASGPSYCYPGEVGEDAVFVAAVGHREENAAARVLAVFGVLQDLNSEPKDRNCLKGSISGQHSIPLHRFCIIFSSGALDRNVFEWHAWHKIQGKVASPLGSRRLAANHLDPKAPPTLRLWRS